jgi:hypothetical protein
MATRKSPATGPAQKKFAAPVARAKLATPTPMPVATRGKEPVKAKPELVRDSFKMPKNEYVLIDELKQRTLRAGRPAKKSEILRAGVSILGRMSDAELMAALASVPSLKTGRRKDAPTVGHKNPSKQK